MSDHLHRATLNASQATTCLIDLAALAQTANRRRARKQLRECGAHLERAVTELQAFAIGFERKGNDQ